MSLLPKSAEEFQLKQYWDKFFTKRSSAFEWYGEYTDLCHVLHKYLKPTNKLLVAGCGNSKLSEALYDAGFHCIDNIDISEVVVRQMTSRNKDKRPKMMFTKMDMLCMSYDNSSYDCVLDKGTLDAIFSNTTDETVAQVDAMFNEVERVLKTSGRYVCITLAQGHILDKILDRFESHWLLRVHRVLLSDDGGGGGGVGSALPVFVFVLTKMMRIPSRPPIKVFEYVVDGSEECVRCEGVEGIASFVKDNQQYALVSHHLSSLHPNKPSVTFDLWSPSVTGEPRYTLAVIDKPKAKVKNGPFAIFIAPQGKETDWLFSCDYGRSQLADSVGFERLVIVTLHRGHTYASLEAVKEEVSGKALELVQSGVTNSKQYPVLTLGDGLGSRVVLQEGNSTHSGPYVVEECTEGEERVRRLVFLDTPHLAQTEMRLTGKPSTSKRSKKNSSSLKPDHTHLLFDFHKVVIATLALVRDIITGSRELKGLLVGLGGGALPMYLGRLLNRLSLDVVELDPEVLSVAEKWFGFSESERVRVHLGDGVQFVRDSTEKKSVYDVVILDVDSKDRSVGVSSPPPSFTTPTFLWNTRALLSDNGIIVTNLAARDKDAKNNILSSFAKTFINVWTIAVPEDVNEIVVASPSITDPGLLSEAVTLAVSQLAMSASKGSAERELAKEWTQFLNSAIKYPGH